ncbi:hypothetical protein Droror1_Dr00014339 [Drosera rotundifolia]
MTDKLLDAQGRRRAAMWWWFGSIGVRGVAPRSRPRRTRLCGVLDFPGRVSVDPYIWFQFQLMEIFFTFGLCGCCKLLADLDVDLFCRGLVCSRLVVFKHEDEMELGLYMSFFM